MSAPLAPFSLLCRRRRREGPDSANTRGRRPKRPRLQFPVAPPTPDVSSESSGSTLTNPTNDPSESFGSPLPINKSLLVTRVAFQNCGPQPELANTSKVHQTTAAFLEGKYDIFMFAEHSLYPPKLSSGNTWHDRMRTGPKHTYSVTSYNRREPHTSSWN